MEKPQERRHEVRFVDAGAPGTAPAAPLDPHWAELSSLVTRVAANRTEMSRLHAERAEMCAEALELVARRVAQRQAARPGRELGDSIPLREVLAELAAALRVAGTDHQRHACRLLGRRRLAGATGQQQNGAQRQDA